MFNARGAGPAATNTGCWCGTCAARASRSRSARSFSLTGCADESGGHPGRGRHRPGGRPDRAIAGRATSAQYVYLAARGARPGDGRHRRDGHRARAYSRWDMLGPRRPSLPSVIGLWPYGHFTADGRQHDTALCLEVCAYALRQPSAISRAPTFLVTIMEEAVTLAIRTPRDIPWSAHPRYAAADRRDQDSTKSARRARLGTRPDSNMWYHGGRHNPIRTTRPSSTAPCSIFSPAGWRTEPCQRPLNVR